MSTRALLTGGAGFAGQWTARALLARGYEVSSAGLHGAHGLRVLDDDEHDAVTWHATDVCDRDAVAQAIDAARPEVVVHLAGISFVPSAAASSVAAYTVNVLGLATLLDVVRVRRVAGVLDPTILVVGSGEQYGQHDDDALPLAETAPQRPLSVYAASKAAQEQVALQAFRGDGLRVMVTRSFNHSGPGQEPHFLLPALVARAVALRASGGQLLALGNTSPVRDFLHVADVAEAYCRLVELGRPGEAYNVCSGEGVSVGALADAVLQRAGVTADISQDPALVRPVDLPQLVGRADKLRQETGWHPSRTRDDIIDDLLRAANAASH